MMTPRGGDLQRALGAFLAADIGQARGLGTVDDLAGAGQRDGRAVGQMIDHGAQRVGGQNGNLFDPRGLGAAGARTDQRAVVIRGRDGGGQRARDRDQPPVQRQLAQGHAAGQFLPGHDVQRGQHGQRDWQVEMRPLLGQIGRRQVHGQPLVRQRDGQRAKGRTDAFLGLADGLVGQTHDGEAG